MKIGVFLILLLIIPSVYAVEFDMKSSFNKDETLLAKISGNFFESISSDDLTLYRGGNRIPMAFSVKKIDNDFYIYAQLLGKTPDNYTLFVNDAKYFQSGVLVEGDLSKNFTILENSSDFKINPGYIYSDGDFFVEVENLMDFEIVVKTKIANESENSSGGGFFDFFLNGGAQTEADSVKVKSGEVKKINFNALDFTPLAIQKIELSTDNTFYQIPVFLTSDFAVNETTAQRIKFEPGELKVTMPFNSNTTRIVYLFNNGENDLENLDLLFSESLKPYIFSEAKNISFLGKNSSQRLEFEFSSANAEKAIEGQIRAKTQDDYYAYISVFLNFVKSYVPTNESGDVAIPSCQELNGMICSENQVCDGGTQTANDGTCCLGTCSEQKTAPYGKYIGWGMIALIFLGLIYFYFRKYRKVRNVVDLLNPRRR